MIIVVECLIMVVAKMALLPSLVEFLVLCNTTIFSKIFVHLWDILKDELEYFQRVQSPTACLMYVRSFGDFEQEG